MKARRPVWRLVAATWGLTLAFAVVTYRHGRSLTFDGYHYCELAKRFTSEWPDRFGNHWPFGYPMAGGLIARLGLPAYVALIIVSAVGLATAIGLTAKMLESQPRRWFIVPPLALAPIVPIQLFGVLTELPFAAALLGLAFSLSRWPARWAIWAAAGCALAALGLRYAGVILLAAPIAWTAWTWPSLGAASRRLQAVGANAAMLVLAIALLWLNHAKTGSFSGADRGGAPGFASLPKEMSDFGWAGPSAIIAGGLRDRVGAETNLGLAIGALVFAALLALCALAWVRPRSRHSRPLALVTIGYATGMSVLGTIGSFDALHNARTFLPVLFSSGILFFEQVQSLRWQEVVAGAVILSGTTAACRGISGEVSANVSRAIPLLEARLDRSDVVGLNDHAFSVSAYLRQPTTRVWAETWDQDRTRFLVVAAPPHGREGVPTAIAPDWRRRIHQVTSAGRCRYLLQTPGLIVLETVPSSPATPRSK